jgi:hypothetical protein
LRLVFSIILGLKRRHLGALSTRTTSRRKKAPMQVRMRKATFAVRIGSFLNWGRRSSSPSRRSISRWRFVEESLADNRHE